jgi:hypothetical protein
MKNLIRKILKEENLKSELKRMVKMDGWRDTYPLVGDPETLAELAYGNDPMKFIDSLGLEKHNGRTSIYFSNYEGSGFLVIPLSLIKVVKVNYELSEFLFDGFKLSQNGARQVIKDWLFDRHGIEIITLYNIFL